MATVYDGRTPDFWYHVTKVSGTNDGSDPTNAYGRHEFTDMLLACTALGRAAVIGVVSEEVTTTITHGWAAHDYDLEFVAQDQYGYIIHPSHYFNMSGSPASSTITYKGMKVVGDWTNGNGVFYNQNTAGCTLHVLDCWFDNITRTSVGGMVGNRGALTPTILEACKINLLAPAGQNGTFVNWADAGAGDCTIKGCTIRSEAPNYFVSSAADLDIHYSILQHTSGTNPAIKSSTNTTIDSSSAIEGWHVTLFPDQNTPIHFVDFDNEASGAQRETSTPLQAQDTIDRDLSGYTNVWYVSRLGAGNQDGTSEADAWGFEVGDWINATNKALQDIQSGDAVVFLEEDQPYVYDYASGYTSFQIRSGVFYTTKNSSYEVNISLTNGGNAASCLYHNPTASSVTVFDGVGFTHSNGVRAFLENVSTDNGVIEFYNCLLDIQFGTQSVQFYNHATQEATMKFGSGCRAYIWSLNNSARTIMSNAGGKGVWILDNAYVRCHNIQATGANNETEPRQYNRSIIHATRDSGTFSISPYIGADNHFSGTNQPDQGTPLTISEDARIADQREASPVIESITESALSAEHWFAPVAQGAGDGSTRNDAQLWSQANQNAAQLALSSGNTIAYRGDLGTYTTSGHLYINNAVGITNLNFIGEFGTKFDLQHLYVLRFNESSQARTCYVEGIEFNRPAVHGVYGPIRNDSADTTELSRNTFRRVNFTDIQFGESSNPYCFMITDDGANANNGSELNVDFESCNFSYTVMPRTAVANRIESLCGTRWNGYWARFNKCMLIELSATSEPLTQLFHAQNSNGDNFLDVTSCTFDCKSTVTELYNPGGFNTVIFNQCTSKNITDTSDDSNHTIVTGSFGFVDEAGGNFNLRETSPLLGL
jgi:hypothetical protein